MPRRRRPADVRLAAAGLLIVMAWAGIGFRLFSVQGVNAAEFAARGADQRLREETLAADRGTIFDRDLVELAVTIKAVTIIGNPRLVPDPERAADVLAPLTGTSWDTLVTRLSRDSEFAYVARQLEHDQAELVRQAVEEAGITGISFVEEPKRVYPARTLAGQVIGFVRADDNVGLEGLEYALEEELSGTPGRLVVERDPTGKPIPLGVYRVEPAIPGSDVVLTIDREIQFAAEQALTRALERTGAKAGTVVVLDPATGEILALANAPLFDPNDRASRTPDRYRNRAVADTFEPGSTLKVVTVAAALEEGLVNARTTFEVPQEIEIHNKTYEDVSRHDQVMSVAEIVAESSNVGTILIQQLLGNEAHYRYLNAFGLGQVASGEFPGETGGLLESYEKWCETTCGPSTAIGYRVGVTALQMAGVFATIANDGVWVQPHVVSELVAVDGTVTKKEPIRRPVVSESTALTMRYLLRGVVESGTGWRAAIDGYTVAGKTGTTEKYLPEEGTYSEQDRIASFIGMAPVADPQVVVAVVLDSPHGKPTPEEDLRFGGVSAAPVFAEVTLAALHQLGVPPDAR